MRFPNPIKVSDLAKQLNAQLLGDDSLLARGINEIHHVETGDITFVDFEKYYKPALNSAASIIIIDKVTDVPEGKALLVVDEPFTAYNNLVLQYRPVRPLNANISPSASIGEGTQLEPGVVVGHEVVIGKNCFIQANVYIADHSIIGDDVIIQSGTIIGADAFYFKKTAEGFTKWRSAGRVVIKNRVDIGSNCTINKGVSSDTVIGEGTKIDCLVQIGHDTKVGTNCLFAAQVGIAGNCTIGNNVTLYGQAGIAQNLTIADGVTLMAQSGFAHSPEEGKAYFGTPAKETRKAYREIAAVKQLPDFLKKLKDL